MSNRSSGGGPIKRSSVGQILLVVAVLLVLWFRSGQLTVEDPVVPAPATVQMPDASGFEAGELDAVADPDAAAPADSSVSSSEEGAGGWEAGSVSTEDVGADGWSSGDVSAAAGVSGLPTILYTDLPDEAKETISLIDQGGPFPFYQDGGTFQNREGILPDRSQGYYQEFTVISPWEDDRGARRIVAGSDGELFYTDDHYDSFREVLR